MKIVSIVGPRKSGKTTTVLLLIEECKKRGLRVATMKTIGCPAFSMDDPNSNTGLHKKAGADLVVARGQRETDFSFNGPLNPNKVFAMMEEDCDIFILEGGTDVMVPRIVCGKTKEEALERVNAHTFLVSGRIADEIDSLTPDEKGQQLFGEKEVVLPAISAVGNITALTDYILENVKDIKLPVEITEVDPKYRGFCTGNCTKDKMKCDF